MFVGKLRMEISCKENSFGGIWVQVSCWRKIAYSLISLFSLIISFPSFSLCVFSSDFNCLVLFRHLSWYPLSLSFSRFMMDIFDYDLSMI